MTLKISQPHIISKTTQGFNEDVKSLMTFNNPSTLHKGILYNQETDTKISQNLQKRYRIFIGSLLYLLKHSQSKLSNTVCEISKCMDKANMIHYKALLRATKYVIDTKGYYHQINPYRNLNGPLELCGYSDTDCAGDNDTFKGITVYIVLIHGLVISWHLPIQKTVTLYVIEAEYFSIMEVFCKIILVRAVLLFMVFFV